MAYSSRKSRGEKRVRAPKKSGLGAELFPLVGDANGEVVDMPSFSGVARTGVSYRLPEDSELCPLPADAQLQFLPGRRALGLNSLGEVVPLEGLAVAARLPVGYTRTLMPAFVRDSDIGDEGEYLPFFGYTAVFARGDELVSAALPTEQKRQWSPNSYHSLDLDEQIVLLKEQYPENKMLGQLEICAKEYGCYNAQNIFYHRWEGAATVSPACNAQCRGCISFQPKGLPASPQERFAFKPTLQEIVELGRYHLSSRDAIFSFGQGCEGEPLLQGDLIAQAVQLLAPIKNRGTIHLNTNASLPAKVQKIVDAGLDSMRISTNSLLPNIYEAYYQPKRYRFVAIKESARIARQAGVFTSLNLLMVPGWIDVEEEVEALISFCKNYDINMIQLRTLNIDPDLYAAHVPRPQGQTIGVPKLLEELKTNCPELRLGNHSPRVRRGECPFAAG